MDSTQTSYSGNSTQNAERNQLLKQLEEANRKLLQAEAYKTYFLSNIRNEINNPMASILSAATCLKEATDLATSHQLATLIHNESRNLNFQMENLFMAAELEAGAWNPAPKIISLQEATDEIIESIQQKADQPEVSIESSCTDAQVFIDPALLRLILMNLIDNAVKFSSSGQCVQVELQHNETELQLTVRDSGIGMDPDKISSVCDRFRQLDEGRCKAHQGHGIGLSATKAALDLTGGTISIDSQPSLGTTCSVCIPLSPPQNHGESEDFEEFFSDDTEVF